MPLPTITTPTYELKMPSTGKKIKYRPFLVKEEKILIIALVALIFIQAISFFWRSFLEWKEGENSENKYLELEKFDEFSNVSEK